MIGVVLAPHYSRMSVGEYRERLEAALDGRDAELVLVESWYDDPAFVEVVADRVRGTDAWVVFTAHSLPERILAAGDPYPDELRATARHVADQLGLDDWAIGWQSAGRTPEPWIGPDVLAIVDESAGTVPGLLVCPCGFVADHLEVLYDLDIEARRVADEVGLAFARTRSLNDDPDVLAALADRVVATADTLA